MKAISLCDGWLCSRLGEEAAARAVTLPHDAMLGERRSATAAGGADAGWFEGRDYVYTRALEAPETWRDQQVTLEFEGVYAHAEVWMNGRLAARRPYGYTNFYVDLCPYLRFDAPNELRVVARNAEQPNSRWYTGAGIFRPVVLWTGPRARHLPPNAIRVTTLGCDPPRVRMDVAAAGDGPIELEILHAGRVLARRQGVVESGRASFELGLPEAPLWQPDAPELLTCRAVFCGDRAETDFGIRELAWSAERGLTVNGSRVILRGACDHHTNGILGAAGFASAEERKVRLLRDAGYNAIRSAHNPCSKALLAACDRLGVLVVDEYADQWYIHKTRHDYADELGAWWPQDLADMVDKDFNHPCVIMYSMGNEVSETAEPRGVELARQMAEHLHALDPTRPVTCGINIFFNGLSALGLGVYSDEKAARASAGAGAAGKGPGGVAALAGAAGSRFYNSLAGLLGAEAMKRGAELPLCDAKTRDAFAVMDVAGYNYGIDRYERDLRAYPGRLIVGTETFCADAYRFWELARNEPRLLGDFVWAGMDYLGETMLGAWEYADYAGNFTGGYGWIAAGQGRLDLTGKAGCETLCTRVAFELDEGPYLGVCPVNHTGERHSPSAWRASNAIASWSWEGCEGRLARVEVYSRAPLVRLELNGRTVAVKTRPAHGCVTRFCCRYAPGELAAVALDRQGRELGRTALRSAAGPTELRAEPEAAGVEPGQLAFVRLRLTDAAGTLKPLERRAVQVAVAGGELVALGHGCPYNEDGYLRDRTDTYFGEALAVVRPSGARPLRLRAWTADGLEAAVEL